MSENNYSGELPKSVTVGAYTVELIKIDHAIAYDSSDYQGSFVAKPPLKMFFDEDIINAGGMDVITKLCLDSETKREMLFQQKRVIKFLKGQPDKRVGNSPLSRKCYRGILYPHAR